MGDEEGASYRVDYIPMCVIQSEPVKRLSYLPRFGRSEDFSAVFSGDQEEIKDYAVGLIFLGSLTLGIFLLWAFIILIFFCCGQSRVGYFSGRPFLRRGMPPDEFDDESSSYGEDDGMHRTSSGHAYEADYGTPHSPEQARPRKKSKRKRKRRSNAAGGDKCCSRPSRVRFLFLLSGCAFITFSILLVTEGMTNLQTTVDTLDATAQNVNAMAAEAQQIIDVSKDRILSLATSLKNRLVTDLHPDNIQQFCPGDPNLEDNEVGAAIAENTDTALQVLERIEKEFQDDGNSELTQLQETLESTKDASATASDTLTKIEMTDWQALIILLPYTIVPALLLAGCIMAYFDVSFAWYKCFISWFVLPIFILMVLFMCIFSSLMAIAAGMNSDFCLPGGNVETSSPDESVANIMIQQGYGPDTMPYKVAKFYVDQCVNSNEDPLAQVREYLQDISSKEGAIEQLVAQLTDESNVAELSLHCNRNFDGVDLLIQNVLQLFRLTLQSMERIVELLSCESIVPLYTTSVYEGTCQYSAKAVWWVYCSTLVMAFTGLLMITLRASYKVSKYDMDPDYNQDDRYYEEDYEEENHQRIVEHPEEYDDYDDDAYQQDRLYQDEQFHDEDPIHEIPPMGAAVNEPPKSPFRGTRPAGESDRQLSVYPDAASTFPEEDRANRRNSLDDPISVTPVYPAEKMRGGDGGREHRPLPSDYQSFHSNQMEDITESESSGGTPHFSVSSNHEDIDDDLYDNNNNNNDNNRTIRTNEDDVTFDDGDFNDGDNVYAGYDRKRDDPPDNNDDR